MSRRLLAAASTVVVLLASAALAWAGDLHPELEAQLRALPPGGTLAVIVEMADQADPVAAAAAAPGRSRRARGRAVVDALRDVAARHQPAIRAFLAREQGRGQVLRAEPLWVINGLAVTATEPVIRQLARRSDVRRVKPDREIPLPAPAPASAGPTSGPVEWNVAQIRAPEAWALGPGFDGTGVVVGSFDTGVDGTHPDLAPRYRGNHSISWFDPYRQHPTPYDANGHGTHTTGTMVGGDAGGTQIGVAPGARWIGAKGWNDLGIATVSVFHQIFQWFLAPGGDPANAPDVVNMSWAFLEPECDPEFLADVQAFRAAGIAPVFAAGNDGPDPGSARSPGAYPESYSVGATDFFDEIIAFSGRGPSQCDGGVKPDVSSPGEGILSTFPGGGYLSSSGTSMAAPHVAGAIALLRSIDPDLTVDEVEDALRQGVLDLGDPGPDNDYGAGRIDLFVSAQIVINGPGLPIVKIVATDPTATEAGLTPGVFTVSRTGATDAELTIGYAVAGTAVAGSDYVPLPGTVTIPAGSATATIVVTPIDDPDAELEETVVVSLSLDPAYIVGNPGSATVSIVSDEIPPDFVVSSLSAPATGEAGTAITITDTTRTLAGEAPASSTRFYLSTDFTLGSGDVLLGSRAVPALPIGGASTGTTTVTIPSASAAGFYYIIAKADADDAILETQEGNNTALAGIFIGPDLVVLSLSAPTSAGAGATVTVNDTTKNQGGGTAGPSTTRFHFSTDITLDGGDTVLGSRSVPGLAPNASSSGSTSVIIPASAVVGLHYILAQADATGAIAESQEGNNVALFPIRVGPDLVVTTLTAPSAAGAGQTFTVSDTTLNQGGGAAGASTTRFYFSQDSVLDTGDTVLGSRAVPALTGGASSAGSTSLTIPSGTAVGLYYLIAQADATSAVVESLETNNTALTAIRIGPDLFIPALTAPPAAGAGQTISVTDTTRNQGGAAPASITRFYLSGNSVLDATDEAIGSRSVPPLAPGASSTGTTSLAIPTSTAVGSYYLIAKADAEDALVETQETNNTALTLVQIGPDLVISAVSAPSAPAAGASVWVSDTTRNQGGGAAGGSTTRLYFSTDTVVDAGDTLLGSRSVPALGGGASHGGWTLVTIPAGTPAGTYHIIAVADADLVVAETYETNNTGLATVQIGPDLVVSSFWVPTGAAAGTTIAVTDTTRNQGGAPAGSSTTRFFLSVNAVLDASDVAMGERAVPALGAGVSSQGSTAVTIPAGTPAGFYYALAVADASGVIGETQEGNNVGLASIRIGPDLIVQSLYTPSFVGSGATITITDTTRNQSGDAAGPSTTRFFFSTDPYLGAGDAPLGQRSVPALGANLSSQGSTAVTLPGGLAVGLYYLLAQADADNVVVESQETNNTALTSVRVGPDLLVWSVTAPSSATAGATIAVTDTTLNQGGDPTPLSSTRFYLSANSVLDASDTLLGARVVPALGANTSSAGTTSLAIPAGTTPGIYYLIVKVDGDDAIIEVYETNNTTLRTLQVTAP